MEYPLAAKERVFEEKHTCSDIYCKANSLTCTFCSRRYTELPVVRQDTY